MNARLLLALALLGLSMCVRAEFILSSTGPQVAPGGALELKLTITNESMEAMTVEMREPLHLRFETDTAVSIVDAIPDRSGEITIAPKQFAVITLRATAPAEVTGPVSVTPTGLQANTLAFLISGPPVTLAAEGSEIAPEPAKPTAEAKLVDKPPPLALSVYEPVYFIMGDDDGLNAKFQISFRYRLFDGEGPLARRLPWIDDLYLSFSQTSLWDLDEISKPFKDSSYRPRLFFANYDLGRVFDGLVRLGVETGAGHESNGKDGDESRSLNMFYVRPTLTFGDPEGFNVYLAPLIHNYVAKDENPDIEDYRGYVDWMFGAGSKGGLNFWALLRKGERSHFGSAELNLSYPLSKLSGGDLTGWLMLQYFGGYGESLLDYNRKLDSQLRLGIAIAL
jgi:phospholipase A1/A2